MWLVRLVFFFLMVVIYLLFILLNFQEMVNVELPFRTYQNIRLVTVVSIGMLIGMLVMFLITLSHELTIRAQLRRLRVEQRRLMEELTSLRTMPFEDLETSDAEREE